MKKKITIYICNWKLRWNFIIYHMFTFKKKITKKVLENLKIWTEKNPWFNVWELNRLYNMLLWTMSYSLRYWPTFHLNLDFYYRLTLVWLWTFQLIQLIMKMVTRWYFCFLVCVVIKCMHIHIFICVLCTEQKIEKKLSGY